MIDRPGDASNVDVIIPTFNRQARLVGTLQSLLRQSVRGFGIIVVDDHSTPPIEQTLPAEIRFHRRVRCFRMPANRGPAAARNLAIAASGATYVAFIDDDMEAAEDWIESLLRRVKASPPHTAVIGPLLPPRDWKPTPWNRWEAAKLETEYRRMAAGEYVPTWRQFFTGNALVPREDVIAAGGFDPEIRRGEDIELGLRLARAGCSFVFEPEAHAWHHAVRTREAWLRDAETYARTDVEIAERYPDLNWLDLIRDELAQRSVLQRGVLRMVPAAGTPLTVRAASLLASVANHDLSAGLSVRAASLAYALTYRRALNHALLAVEQRRRESGLPFIATNHRSNNRRNHRHGKVLR